MAVLASACGSSSDNADTSPTTEAPVETGLVDEGTPQEGGKVVMAVTAETNGWNPAIAQWADAGNFVGSTFLEPMFVYNENTNIVPWAASDIFANDEHSTSWTLKLRSGITFHDGTPVNAQTVANGLNIHFREGLAAIALDTLVTTITVVDEFTIRIDLSIQWAAFPNVLAGPVGYLMSQSMVDAGPPDYGGSNPVGTGPFEFESWKPDESVKVRRFDGYWGGPCALAEPEESVKELCAQAGTPLGQPNGPFLDAMEFRPIVDPQQRANALEAGDVDLIMSTRAADVRDLMDDYRVVTDFNSEKTFVEFNTSKAPFDNIHARKAVGHATDRAAVVAQVSAGQDIRSDTSPFSEDSKWGGFAPDDTGYLTYDPEAARAELEAYKADTGADTLSFALLGLTTSEDLALMQTLQEQWRQVGIEASVDTIEQTQYIIKLTQGAFDAVLFRNYGYPDPDSQYVFWSEVTATPPIIINFSQYTSSDHEDALQLGRFAPDFEVRRAAYQNLSRERNEQVIDVWLFNTPYSVIGDRNIGGLNWFEVHPFGNFMPKPWIGGLWVST